MIKTLRLISGLIFLQIILILFPTGCIWAQTMIVTPKVSASITPTPTPYPITNTKGLSITLSPSFLNLIIDAGKTAKYSIKITNNNQGTEYLSLASIRLVANSAGDSIVPSDTDPNDETLKWMRLPSTIVIVEGKSTVSVPFEVVVPQDASLGYYFGIVIRRASESKVKEMTKLVGEAMIPIMLEVTTPNADKKSFNDVEVASYKSGAIANFTTSSWWYEFLPVDFDVKFENLGKVHMAPFGNIIIEQKGKEVGSLEINNTNGNTLPRSSRTYKTSWEDGFIVREPVKDDNAFTLDKQGNIVTKAVIHWDAISKIRLGRYSAKAYLVYNNGVNDVPLEANLFFWIIPWRILLVLALLVTLIILGVRSIIRGIFK